jgi:hypothetical protein
VAVGILEVGVAPAPRHVLWQLLKLDAVPGQIATDHVQVVQLQVKTNAFVPGRAGLNRNAVEADGGVTIRSQDPGIVWEPNLDGFEPELTLVKVERDSHVRDVKENVVESHLDIIGWSSASRRITRRYPQKIRICCSHRSSSETRIERREEGVC